jgi:hypothetical protein
MNRYVRAISISVLEWVGAFVEVGLILFTLRVVWAVWGGE